MFLAGSLPYAEGKASIRVPPKDILASTSRCGIILSSASAIGGAFLGGGSSQPGAMGSACLLSHLLGIPLCGSQSINLVYFITRI